MKSVLKTLLMVVLVWCFVFLEERNNNMDLVQDIDENQVDIEIKLIDVHQLAAVVNNMIENVLVVDSRSFLEYNTCHVSSAINVCSSKLIKRRLQQDKIHVNELLNIESASSPNHVNNLRDVIVYDQGSIDYHSLPSDSFVQVLLHKLLKSFKSVCLVKGGFLEFQSNYPKLCDKDKTRKGSSLTSLSQPCLPITNQGPTRILPFLYLGSQQDALNRDLLKDYNINYELNVTQTCPKPDFVPDCHFMRIAVNDNYNEKISPFFAQAYEFLDRVRKSNGCVLVHCLAGISRSAAVTISYIMRHLALTSDEAYRFVKSKRAIISPNFNFLGQLLEYEKQLRIDQPEECRSAPADTAAHRRSFPLMTRQLTLKLPSKNFSKLETLMATPPDEEKSTPDAATSGEQSPTTALSKLSFSNHSTTSSTLVNSTDSRRRGIDEILRCPKVERRTAGLFNLSSSLHMESSCSSTSSSFGKSSNTCLDKRSEQTFCSSFGMRLPLERVSHQNCSQQASNESNLSLSPPPKNKSSRINLSMRSGGSSCVGNKMDMNMPYMVSTLKDVNFMPCSKGQSSCSSMSSQSCLNSSNSPASSASSPSSSTQFKRKIPKPKTTWYIDEPFDETLTCTSKDTSTSSTSSSSSCAINNSSTPIEIASQLEKSDTGVSSSSGFGSEIGSDLCNDLCKSTSGASNTFEIENDDSSSSDDQQDSVILRKPSNLGLKSSSSIGSADNYHYRHGKIMSTSSQDSGIASVMSSLFDSSITSFSGGPSCVDCYNLLSSQTEMPMINCDMSVTIGSTNENMMPQNICCVDEFESSHDSGINSSITSWPSISSSMITSSLMSESGLSSSLQRRMESEEGDEIGIKRMDYIEGLDDNPGKGNEMDMESPKIYSLDEQKLVEQKERMSLISKRKTYLPRVQSCPRIDVTKRTNESACDDYFDDYESAMSLMNQNRKKLASSSSHYSPPSSSPSIQRSRHYYDFSGAPHRQSLDMSMYGMGMSADLPWLGSMQSQSLIVSQLSSTNKHISSCQSCPDFHLQHIVSQSQDITDPNDTQSASYRSDSVLGGRNLIKVL